MYETVVTVVGRLVRDPDVRFLEDGTALCRFTVAATSRVFDRAAGGWRDGETAFVACSAWRAHAENIAESVGRGTRVIVVGELRQRRYTAAEGVARTAWEVRVHEVAPALRWTAAEVSRVGRAGGWGAGARRSVVPPPRTEDAAGDTGTASAASRAPSPVPAPTGGSGESAGDPPF
ncbi:single-strand DNA-binding protein [Nocardiopsis mwathae]|uniref:Single-stranded DNA-binding protein n=1 Tax=Nocardiopsis mwathae TaxID=1472723 RepID=A0A7W9YJ89_9ACTN|nr:single-strand DNA-binding protein [Nocardiopsis mwathae]